MPKPKKKQRPGPAPEVLKIEGDWKDAMRKLISKKRPVGAGLKLKRRRRSSGAPSHVIPLNPGSSR